MEVGRDKCKLVPTCVGSAGGSEGRRRSPAPQAGSGGHWGRPASLSGQGRVGAGQGACVPAYMSDSVDRSGPVV